MKVLWLLLAFMCSGCALKQQLFSKRQERVESKKESAMMKEQQNAQWYFSHRTDSLQADYAFKIYPRGQVLLNRDGFWGAIDSLFWYGKQQHLQQQTEGWQNVHSANEKQLATENLAHTKEAVIKEKQKFSLSWWYFFVFFLTVLALYGLWKKVSRFFGF